MDKLLRRLNIGNPRIYYEKGNMIKNKILE
jgi:hypothetical protein